MENYNHRKSFVFKNKAEGLASVVMHCVDYIKTQNELFNVPAGIHAKIKWTLTELLINGAKHSGSEESIINLNFGNADLSIEKIDNGKPLQLAVKDDCGQLSWPLENKFIQQHYEVYRNGIDSLQIYTSSDCEALFEVIEIEEQEEEMPLLLVNTSDHFGLMIISKASDHFAYRYDQNLQQNIFTILFQYEQ